MSAVDLIKGCQTDKGGETSAEQLKQPAEEGESQVMRPTPNPPPPWLQEGERESSSVGEHTAVMEEEEDNYQDSFVAEVRRFVQRNSEMFDLVTKEEITMATTPTLHNLKSDASCELQHYIILFLYDIIPPSRPVCRT